MQTARTVALATGLLISACGTDGDPPGGAPDAGGLDAGVDAAGTFDGGRPEDASSADAGRPGGWVAVLEEAQRGIEEGATEVSLSADGRIVYGRSLEGGAVVAEEIRVDGRTVATWTHSEGESTERWDRDADGHPERTVTTTRGTAPDHHTLVELDPDDDGTVDRRVTFDRSGDVVQVTTEDADGAGGWTLVAEATTTPWQAESLTVVADGDGSEPCSTDQVAALEEALRDAIEEGGACLGDEDLAGLGRVLMRGVELRCEDLSWVASTTCALARTAVEESGASPGDGPVVVIVDPGQMFTGRCGSDLSRTLFHELMHSVRGGHGVAGDPVRACETLCYGSPSQEECVTCLGAYDCDRCGSYPSQAHVCSCDGASYPSLTECQVSCRSGLGCFSAGCDPAPACP